MSRAFLKYPLGRIHCHPWSASPQSQEPLAVHSTQPANRRHRRIRIRKVVVGFRHRLRRGATSLCGIAIGLRAPVPGTHGKARCGRNRRHRAPHCHSPKEYDTESPFHGGDIHGNLRFSAALVRPRGPQLLPQVRRASAARHGGSCGPEDAQPARGLPLVCPFSDP
jgi:hypothetical protein